MKDRDQCIEDQLHTIEEEMELLGISGVEDKLQEDITDCLSQLNKAGISTWMITGDKLETAICIGISAGLKTPMQSLYAIHDQTNPFTLKNELNKFSTQTDTVLAIDGVSIQTALNDHPDYFYTVATKAPAVICCRVSPTQKAVLTLGVKNHTGNDAGTQAKSSLELVMAAMTWA